jgi:hypothetical protein
VLNCNKFTGLVRDYVLMVGVGDVNGENKGEFIWSRYFIDLHEIKTLKSVEIVLTIRQGDYGE